MERVPQTKLMGSRKEYKENILQGAGILARKSSETPWCGRVGKFKMNGEK